jgi:hypothetical protein
MAKTRHMTIHFTDGSKLSVAFPTQSQDDVLMASKIQKALDANQLAIDVDGEMFVIPMNSVKYLQVTPAPEKLPDSVIRGATLKHEY